MDISNSSTASINNSFDKYFEFISKSNSTKGYIFYNYYQNGEP